LEQTPWVWTDLDVTLPPAYDPKLDGAGQIPIQIRGTGYVPEDCTVHVVVHTLSGLGRDLGTFAAPVGTLSLDLSWDGRLDDGLWADPGPVQVAADLRCSDHVAGFGEGRSFVVRLGISGLDFGVDGDPGKAVLAWNKVDLFTPSYEVLPHRAVEWRNETPVGELADLDLDDGTPRPLPAPYGHATVAPWGPGEPDDLRTLNAPLAYEAGSSFTVALIPGLSAVSARTGGRVDARGPLLGQAELPILRIVADGLRNLDEGDWSPGRPVRFASSPALAVSDTLGRTNVDLTWRFQALQGQTWVDVPGEVTTTHTVYPLAGQPQVADGTARGASPSVSWVGVLEDLNDVIDGIPAEDHEAIMDALRDGVHRDPWVIYNPNDSAYSTFEGRYIYWSRIWLEMSDWLDRRQGIDLYCHSVACLLSSQANHLGLEAEYITLVNRSHPETGALFTTFLTRAAGSTQWRRWTFNSHGIARLGDQVWDAAVDIDGDDTPSQEPVEATPPLGLSFDAYADLLTADDMVIVNYGRCDNY
jgi:hypothetical protein